MAISLGIYPIFRQTHVEIWGPHGATQIGPGFRQKGSTSLKISCCPYQHPTSTPPVPASKLLYSAYQRQFDVLPVHWFPKLLSSCHPIPLEFNPHLFANQTHRTKSSTQLARFALWWNALWWNSGISFAQWLLSIAVPATLNLETHPVGGFNHLEKHEFVNGKDDIPYMKWKIKNVPNHQPVIRLILYWFKGKKIQDANPISFQFCLKLQLQLIIHIEYIEKTPRLWKFEKPQWDTTCRRAPSPGRATSVPHGHINHAKSLGGRLYFDGSKNSKTRKIKDMWWKSSVFTPVKNV